MKPRNVVVTGIGLVTPLGATARESGEAWMAGLSARKRDVPEFAGSPLASAQVAVLPEFDPAERLGGRRMLKYMSEAAVLGCLAAREALVDADAKERFAPEEIGLYAATGLAAANVDDIRGTLEASIDDRGEFSERLLGERGLAVTNPLISFKILANMPPCLISVMEEIKGPNLIFTPWEGQAGAALMEGWLAVREGLVPAVLTGAADSAAHPSTLVYLRQAGLLSETDYPASGAAYLFLERAETAWRDQRRIYAVLEEVTVTPGEGEIVDPLARRLGRLFAAAPPVLLALECLTGGRNATLCGTDRQSVSFRLGVLP